MKWITIILILGYLEFSRATLAGPFLLWGTEKLENLKLPALVEADEESLTELFSEAKAVIIFIRNNTSRLDGVNYPKFRELIAKNIWAYLPQHSLAVDPFHYNTNVKSIKLSVSASQQDKQIASLFKESVSMYGEGAVLGILSYREDDVHSIHKRDVNEEQTTTAMTTTADEPTEVSFIYRAPGKAILYTTSAPLLNIHVSGEHHTFSLMEHDKENTFDDRNEWSRLNIGFKVNNTRLRLRFNFTMSASKYWSLSSVEVEYKEYHNTMPLEGPDVIAPKGFSYRCSTRTLFFRNEEDNLTISDYQVQPWLKKNVNRFSDAYDCVGFTTVPIWSGLFVSALLVGLLFVGILALLDIKTPNRFESSRTKQLTFTVLE